MNQNRAKQADQCCKVSTYPRKLKSKSLPLLFRHEAFTVRLYRALISARIYQENRFKEMINQKELHQTKSQVVLLICTANFDQQLPYFSSARSRQFHYNLFMWNYHLPFFNSFVPLSPYNWAQFASPYMSQPFLPFSYPPLLKQEDHNPTLENLSPETPIQQYSLPKDTIASRVERKTRPIRTHRKKEKEDSFDKKRQKKDRNLPSNICRFFICFLYQHSCPEKVYGATSENEVIIIHNCISQVKKYIKSNQTYIRPSLIQRMCKGELIGPANAPCFRAMFHRFVKVELRMIVSMMGKLRKKEKLAYFKISNKFLKQFMPKP